LLVAVCWYCSLEVQGGRPHGQNRAPRGRSGRYSALRGPVRPARPSQRQSANLAKPARPAEPSRRQSADLTKPTGPAKTPNLPKRRQLSVAFTLTYSLLKDGHSKTSECGWALLGLGYGNWCGYGNKKDKSGKALDPQDGWDTCCMHHDKCFDAVEKHRNSGTCHKGDQSSDMTSVASDWYYQYEWSEKENKFVCTRDNYSFSQSINPFSWNAGGKSCKEKDADQCACQKCECDVKLTACLEKVYLKKKECPTDSPLRRSGRI